jgi:hypothetical protein
MNRAGHLIGVLRFPPASPCSRRDESREMLGVMPLPRSPRPQGPCPDTSALLNASKEQGQEVEQVPAVRSAMLVDTGASGSAVDHKVIERLGFAANRCHLDCDTLA